MINFENSKYYVKMEEGLYKYMQEHQIMRIYNQAIIFSNIEYCNHLVDFARSFLTGLFKKANIA
jgi:hypothetical protein